MKLKLILMVSGIMLGVLGSSCTATQNFDARLESIVKSLRFTTIAWELKTLPHEVNQWIFGGIEKIDDEARVVTDYFSTVRRIEALKREIQATSGGTGRDDSAALEAELHRLQEQKTASEAAVEWILEKQVIEALAEQGIFHPYDNYLRLPVNLPPLNFKLEKPPHLLVISPRDRIESVREIILQQDISLEEMTTIESEADRLGVSSLVVELGGLGSTYPSFVTNEASLRFTINTAAEEWLHQYLFFRPLGILYALDLTGVSPNYEIATMNETVAGMVSKEIGAIVTRKHYSHYERDNQSQIDGFGFDFDQEMRDIRREVDKYLAQGEIEQAEEFMEQKRQFLASNGYYIRKLNQAYFAFHGVYADRPTSISPIGVELRELRERSTSLNEFLDKVSVMTSRQDLIDSLK